jgi:hypothetical protein
MARRVYVIELDREAGRRRDPRLPWLYVGSSSRSPEERFDQHRRGYKSAGLVKRHGVRLRPELYEDLAPIRGSRDAVAAEQRRARELADCGFVAHSDGVSYGEREGDWSAWDAERLEVVAPRLRAAAEELRSSAFEPLPGDRCARLLHGEIGFWVAGFIDPVDPPPAYGMFAHADLEAIEAQLACMQVAGPLPQ